jgi:hypothetical protein
MNIKTGFELLPKPIVDHISSSINVRENIAHMYHVTELIYCLRKAYYRRVYPDRENRSLRGSWNIYRGATFDRLWTPLFKINQRTLNASRRGMTIVGTLDFIFDDGTGPALYDLKMPASTFYKSQSGVGLGYSRQVQAYLSLAHFNGLLLDVHRVRVLMVAEDIVVEEFGEWTDMLDSWLWPRAFLLDNALNRKDPTTLRGPESPWECDPEYCPADVDFRIASVYLEPSKVKEPERVLEDEPEPEYVTKIREMIY